MKLGRVVPVEFNVAVFVDEKENKEVCHELWTKEGKLYTTVNIKENKVDNSEVKPE